MVRLFGCERGKEQGLNKGWVDAKQSWGQGGRNVTKPEGEERERRINELE